MQGSGWPGDYQTIVSTKDIKLQATPVKNMQPKQIFCVMNLFQALHNAFYLHQWAMQLSAIEHQVIILHRQYACFRPQSCVQVMISNAKWILVHWSNICSRSCESLLHGHVHKLKHNSFTKPTSKNKLQTCSNILNPKWSQKQCQSIKFSNNI